MGISCVTCKYSSFDPTVGVYKCSKHNIECGDVCFDFENALFRTFAPIPGVQDYDINLGILDDGKEEGEE